MPALAIAELLMLAHATLLLKGVVVSTVAPILRAMEAVTVVMAVTVATLAAVVELGGIPVLAVTVATAAQQADFRVTVAAVVVAELEMVMVKLEAVVAQYTGLAREPAALAVLQYLINLAIVPPLAVVVVLAEIMVAPHVLALLVIIKTIRVPAAVVVVAVAEAVPAVKMLLGATA
jgi:hypothetical protein